MLFPLLTNAMTFKLIIQQFIHRYKDITFWRFQVMGRSAGVNRRLMDISREDNRSGFTSFFHFIENGRRIILSSNLGIHPMMKDWSTPYWIAIIDSYARLIALPYL